MTEVDELKAIINAQNWKYERKKAENERLKFALQTLLQEDDSSSDAGTTTINDANGGDDMAEDVLTSDFDEGDDDDALPTPIWNESEKTFFCTACTWEVVDGECCQCGLKHAWEENPEMLRDRIHNENCIIHPNRNLYPRGTTPVRELTPEELGDTPPKGYTPELYWALLQRGISESMCWNYRIKYTYQGGIWVEFDPSSRLYKETLHSSFHNGLKWRVYLGRQVQLADDDPDGTDFIESLIEDAVFFPYRETQSRRTYEVWETVMKSGVWLTRPKGSATQEENEWTSDQDDQFEDEDMKVAGEEAAKAEDQALDTGASLFPRPFMNDYLPESEYEESDTEENQLMEGMERVNLDAQPNEATGSQDVEGQQSSEETESSDEEMDELEDEEAAIHLFGDTVWEPSSGEDEDTTSDWTTESESEESVDSDAEWFEARRLGLC